MTTPPTTTPSADILTYIFVKPHCQAVTPSAMRKLARIAQLNGKMQFDKALYDILAGKRPGGYCSECGLELEFIRKCSINQPYRLICHRNTLSVQAVERQHGQLIAVHTI